MSTAFRELCVLVPTYCGSATLERSLNSLLSQTIQPSCVYIRDDTPPSNVDERRKIALIVEQFQDQLKIKLDVNASNLGYPRNIAELVKTSSEEFVFLLAQDDLLSPLAIETCLHALQLFPNAGGVSRPYFWFDDYVDKPVRWVPPLDQSKPSYVTQKSSWIEIQRVLFSAGQLTGLMYRRSRLREPFIDSVFPAHVAPFAGLLRDFGVVYIPDVTVAVSIRDSQTRFLNSIYKESPTLEWISMYRSVFGLETESRISRMGRRIHMGLNYVGLIQIRTHGRFSWFLREALILVWCRPLNLIDPRYIISVISLSVVPRRLSRWIADSYKSSYLSRRLTGVRLLMEPPEWWGTHETE